MDVGFYKAMELTKLEFLDRVNYYGRVWWAFWDIVSNSIKERFSVHSSGRVLEFAQGRVPWKEYLIGLEKENNLTRDSREGFYKLVVSCLIFYLSQESWRWRRRL